MLVFEAGQPLRGVRAMATSLSWRLSGQDGKPGEELIPAARDSRFATRAQIAQRPVDGDRWHDLAGLQNPDEGLGIVGLVRDQRRGRLQSSVAARSRSALAMTLNDDSAIAAAAMMGDSSRPKAGYKTPAAMGTPAAL